MHILVEWLGYWLDLRRDYSWTYGLTWFDGVITGLIWAHVILLVLDFVITLAYLLHSWAQLWFTNFAPWVVVSPKTVDKQVMKCAWSWKDLNLAPPSITQCTKREYVPCTFGHKEFANCKFTAAAKIRRLVIIRRFFFRTRSHSIMQFLETTRANWLL